MLVGACKKDNERGKITMDKICAFFGHREIGRDISKSLEQAVRLAIADGATIFWVGGYGMFDACAAGCVRRLKKEYKQISLHLIFAYLPTEKDTFLDIYDSTIFPEGLELVPRRFAISHRNRWIADHCDMVIGCIDHAYGGAYTAFQLAKRKGKAIVNIGELDKRNFVL